MNNKKEKILAAVARLNSLGIQFPTRALVARYAGYSGVTPGFKKALSSLIKDKLIVYPDSTTVALTAAAMALPVARVPLPKTCKEARAHIKTFLTPKSRQIFDILSDGETHSRIDVALLCGYTPDKLTGFKKALSPLVCLGIAEYPSETEVRLTDKAFPFGRPDVIVIV
jgi:hypothetical protein